MSLKTPTSSRPPSSASRSLISGNAASSGTSWIQRSQLEYPLRIYVKLLTTSFLAQTSPTSITPFFTTLVIPITHTPVSFTPAESARWIGAGPRRAGRRDGWTFSAREGRKRERSREGRMRPKEAVMSRCCGDGGPLAEATKGAGGCR